MEVKANVAFDIKLPVVNLSGTLKITGTVYVLISKAATNEVWSTGSGGQWVTRANATLPSIEAPVTSGETWFFSVPAAVTNGLSDMTRLFIILQDSATPGSITAISPTVEVLVRSDVPAIVGSAVGAAASVTAGVTLAADQAVNVTKIDGVALASHPAGLFPSSATLLSGTASAGAAGSITLADGSSTNKLYNGCLVVITGGTGAGQARTILNYVGSTKVATVTRHWAVNPSSDSVYVVIGGDVSTLLESGTAAGGAAGSITLDSNSSAVDHVYEGNIVMVSSGTGAGQSRIVTGYVGSTKVASVSPDWATVPDTTSAYQLMPGGRADVGRWLGAAIPTPTTAGVPTVDAAAPTADAVADAVRTELSAELAHMNADVGDCATDSGLSAAVETITDAIGDIPAAPSAADVADSVWDEVLAGHATAGSTAKTVSDLRALAGAGGAYSTTLRVVDGDGDPIADVKFSLYAAGALYTTGAIGPTGVRVIGLQAATYSIRLARAGVDFGAPTTFTVAADGETKTFTGTLVTLPVSDDPDYCRISGTLRDAGGNILADQVIRFRVVVPGAVGAATGVSVWVEVTSDDDGVFSVDMVRGTVVQVDCQPAGYALTEKTVPDAAGQNFQDWA